MTAILNTLCLMVVAIEISAAKPVVGSRKAVPDIGMSAASTLAKALLRRSPFAEVAVETTRRIPMRCSAVGVADVLHSP